MYNTMLITKVNERCQAVQKSFFQTDACFVDGKCSCCGSIDALTLEQNLIKDKFGFYNIPTRDGWVDKLILHNDFFVFYHLFDEPLTDIDYNRILDLIENVCGSLQVYLKEYNKYFQ